MKFMKDNTYYVEKDDILYLEPYPSIFYEKLSETNKYVKIVNYDNLDSIISYDVLKDLTLEELNEKIQDFKLNNLDQENSVLKYQLITLKNYLSSRSIYDNEIKKLLKHL